MPLIEFKKDYKQFKQGQFLQIPDKAYTGDIKILIIWEEIAQLLDDGIVERA